MRKYKSRHVTISIELFMCLFTYNGWMNDLGTKSTQHSILTPEQRSCPAD